MITDHMSI